MKLVNVGFGNMVARRAAGGHCQPGFRAVRRLVQDARETGRVIDATYGRRTRAVIIMDSDHVVLSPLQPETVAGRMDGRNGGEGEDAE